MAEVLFARSKAAISDTPCSTTGHPDFGTELGFVSRVDQQQFGSTLYYKWWPESWIVNWGPQLNYPVTSTIRAFSRTQNEPGR